MGVVPAKRCRQDGFSTDCVLRLWEQPRECGPVAAAAAGVGTALAMANVDDFPMSEIDVQHWPIGA